MTSHRVRSDITIALLVTILPAADSLAGGAGPATTPASMRAASRPAPDVLWDIGDSGLFDKTNKAYPFENGVVSIDLGSPQAACPMGLGELSSDRKVKEIRLKFSSTVTSEYFLHVQWDPGGSGKEQFEVLLDSGLVGRSPLVNASERPYEDVQDRFPVRVRAGKAELSLVHLSGDGLRFRNIVLTSDEEPPAAAVNPELAFPTLNAYQAEIKEPAIMLDSPHVRLFAPKARQQEAHVIFGYLSKAYDELYRLVGIHTKFKIVVYHFPKSSRNFSGGTSNCTIRYGYKNLDLTNDPEWKAHRVPHVSGYIEEMAHNFVDASKAQFGWEMIGWTIGMKASLAVAGNPTLQQSLQSTRDEQTRTFQRYVSGGYVFPRDIPANLCDRIHAEILWQAEEEYGKMFWSDFFSEAPRRRVNLVRAKDRDERYRITVECFDSLKGLRFKDTLKKAMISTTTDAKSLNPESPQWDRTFRAPHKQ